VQRGAAPVAHCRVRDLEHRRQRLAPARAVSNGTGPLHPSLRSTLLSTEARTCPLLACVEARAGRRVRGDVGRVASVWCVATWGGIRDPSEGLRSPCVNRCHAYWLGDLLSYQPYSSLASILKPSLVCWCRAGCPPSSCARPLATHTDAPPRLWRKCVAPTLRPATACRCPHRPPSSS